MPTLTLEALRQNPWNVLTHELPDRPSRLLLIAAQIAATCCREIEAELLDLTGEQNLAQKSEMKISTNRWSAAHRKIGILCGLLEDRFGIQARDLSVMRNST